MKFFLFKDKIFYLKINIYLWIKYLGYRVRKSQQTKTSKFSFKDVSDFSQRTSVRLLGYTILTLVQPTQFSQRYTQADRFLEQLVNTLISP